jgi:outer membrane lipoprotein-sorting protein
MTKRISVVAMMLLTAVARADVPPPPGPAQPAGPPAPAPAAKPLGPNSTVDDVLNALDDRGQTLTSFTADIKTTDQDLVYDGDPIIRTGKIWFQTGPASTTLHLILDKKTKGKVTVNEKIEYQLDGVWLTDRDYTARIETKRQIARAGQKVNLFQLGKGPFPLPIGQKKADVLKEFDVKKDAFAKGDPPNSIHLELTPKPGTQLAQSFFSIEVWVDPADNFPVRIETVDSKHAMDKITDFSNVVINAQIKPADLQPEKIDASWKTSSVPMPQKGASENGDN